MFLTKRQKELLDYLEEYLRLNGYAPTLEEIADRFELSSLATVHKHLSNLEEKRLIRRHWNHSRAIELVPRRARPSAVELPLLGNVAAGEPIEALENDETFTVPESFVRRGKTFVLRVRGNSMVEDGIWDGDFVVVEEREAATNGETIVAMVNGGATVKRFFREKGGRVRLVPANAEMAPILVRAEELRIRGIVVAVLRKY